MFTQNIIRTVFKPLIISYHPEGTEYIITFEGLPSGGLDNHLTVN